MISVSAETMRELDRIAVNCGISTLFLMENAGEAIAKKTAGILKNPKWTKVALFCGRGNNGGDGFVAARKLKEFGFNVNTFLFGKQNQVKDNAAINLKLFLEAGGEVEEINSDTDIERLKRKLDHSLIIDALLGTGFSGAISGLLKKLIELLNSTKIPILAIDIPSGLDSTSGRINPTAIQAKWTLSFALPKKGFYKNNGPDYTGEVEITNIGFPDILLEKAIEFEKKICMRL